MLLLKLLRLNFFLFGAFYFVNSQSEFDNSEFNEEESYDTSFRISPSSDLPNSKCYNSNGEPKRCSPDFINAAYNRAVEATNTCGITSYFLFKI